jgi:hypothetical protein
MAFVRKVLFLALLGACKSPPIEEAPYKEPPPSIQSLTDRWGSADPASLPKAGPELMKGRKALLVGVEQRITSPMKTTAQDAGGACWATRVEEVGLVIVARAKNETPRINDRRVRMFDRTWQIDAIAVPEGKIVASWTRFTTADEGSVVLNTRTLGSPRVGGQDNYARFPRTELESDCASIQAGIVPGAQADASP